MHANSFVYTDHTCQNDTLIYNFTSCGEYIWVDADADTIIAVCDSTGVYTRHLQTVLGCDSIQILNLTINPVYETHIVDTMCGYFPYTWQDTIFTQGGQYTKTFSTIHGCDSIFRLTLVDNPIALLEGYDSVFCAGEAICLDLQYQGFVHKWMVSLSDNANNEGARDMQLENSQISSFNLSGLTPGEYSLTVEGFFDDTSIIKHSCPFTVHFPSSIFEQRSSDLIAVLNANYNGGYDFVEFQWFANGCELIGETNSYLNRPLALGVEYTVLLKDSRGVQVMSCPIEPNNMDGLAVSPSVVSYGQTINCYSSEDATVYVFSHSGYQVQKHSISADEIISIDCPAIPGIYLVEILTHSYKRHAQIIIVK